MFFFNTEKELADEAKRRGCKFAHRRCYGATFHRTFEKDRDKLLSAGEGTIMWFYGDDLSFELSPSIETMKRLT